MSGPSRPPAGRPRETLPTIRMLTEGEGGIVVELGDAIDPEVNARVRRLAAAIEERLREQILEVVPTYRSLLVLFDPLRVSRAALVRELTPLAAARRTARAREAVRTVSVPVCYGGAFGPDLDFVAAHAGMGAEEVVRIHASGDYLVHMLGFTPGFPYLGGMSPRIAAPRLEAPRPRIPTGSVGIAGEQTGIYPVESPGGWRLIGRTPLRLFDPAGRPPFLLAPGDRLRFVAISPEEYDDIAARVDRGTYAPEIRT